MQNKQFRLSYLVVIILIGVLVCYLGFTSYRRNVPRDLYQVYVDGKVIGIIESEEDFDNYINKKQEDIKKAEWYEDYLIKLNERSKPKNDSCNCKV